MEQQACPILHEPGSKIHTGNKSRGHPQVSLCQLAHAKTCKSFYTQCSRLTPLRLVRQMVQDGSITSDQAVHMTDLYDMLGGLDVHNAVGVLFEKPHTSHYAQASCLAKLTAQRAVMTL